MKILKRAVAVFSAVATLTALGSIPASAYDDCDVNQDGVVDISDAVEEAKYLAGKQYGGYYNRYDTNKSLTVDAADSDKIMAHIMGLTYQAKYWSKTYASTVNFPTVSGFTPDSEATSTTSRQYIKYNYSSGQTSTYWLTPPSEALSKDIPDDWNNIIGDNNLTPSSGVENTGIVRIICDDTPNTYRKIGTGFIVGKHVIATAAENVYGSNGVSGSTKHFFPDISVRMYNANGTISNTYLEVKEAHIATLYTTATNTDVKRAMNYALITVEENLNSYTRFQLGTTYNVSETNYSNIPLYLLGPGVFAVDPNTNLYYCEGHIINNYKPASQLIMPYDIDTVDGECGAPVYTVTRVQYGNEIKMIYTAIAINLSYMDYNSLPAPVEYNFGSRITKYQLQFYDEHTNTNISY